MIKLISSDMDGTLLDSYRQITPINVEAIKRAQEKDFHFYQKHKLHYCRLSRILIRLFPQDRVHLDIHVLC